MIFDHFDRPLKHWKAYIVLYANFCSRKTMLFTQTNPPLDKMMELFIPQINISSLIKIKRQFLKANVGLVLQKETSLNRCDAAAQHITKNNEKVLFK